MNIQHQLLFITLALGSTLATAHAQFGPPGGLPQGPHLGGSTARLFGQHTAFSAVLETQTKGATATNVTKLSGKVAFDHGNFRFELDLSQLGDKMPAAAAAQLKTMGMDQMVTISRPDKKLTYQVYPGMQAYVEHPIAQADALKSESDYKFETMELGRETVDGHPCVKNKAIVTDPDGNKTESTIWNATDLGKFPIKIEQLNDGVVSTLLFKEVNLAKPEAAKFEPPANFARHDNLQKLMQQQMMKRFTGGQGLGGADKADQ